MKRPEIRVIVPCHNSDLTAEKCISSILESEGIDFELFLTDDGGNSNLESIKSKYQFNIIRTAGHTGAGKARNAGTEGFDGRIVVFIDSDVQIGPGTLVMLTDPIIKNMADATVGSYSGSKRTNFFETYKHNYLSHRYGSPGYLSNTFWSAICAIDFSLFKKTGGFRECYSGAGPEDIDTGVELTSLGARILSVPGATGVHLASYNFLKLLSNDFRKGSEDIYIHLLRNVPILHNRHVTMIDIFAVFLACLLPLMIVLLTYTGIIPVLLCVLAYAAIRGNFIRKVFAGEGTLTVMKSSGLTWILDIVRGTAVLNGTLLYLLRVISGAKVKPFSARGDYKTENT